MRKHTKYNDKCKSIKILNLFFIVNKIEKEFLFYIFMKLLKL